ncbi:MAG TPA: acyl-CoA dehydrogenase family protein [Solirubrobacterales bacterium]
MSARRDPVRAATEIAGRVLAPGAAHRDSTGEFPLDALDALGQAGLLGMLVPREYGGLGASIETFADVVVELGRACASTAMVVVMHHSQYVMLVDHGADAQKQFFLPPIARGEQLVASATTEPEVGGNSAFCVSARRIEGDSIRLTAVKPVVTSANHADWVYCTTRTSADAAGDELSMVIMPGLNHSDDVTPFGQWDCVGMRATASSGLRFDDCLVPRWHQIGPDNSAHVRRSSMSIVARIGFAAVWQGIADSAFAATLAHVKAKEHEFIRRDRDSGTIRSELRTLAESETTRRQLAEMRVRLLASNELLRSAARLVDNRRGPIIAGAPAGDVQERIWAARVACGQSAIEVTRQGLRLCGVTALRAGKLPLERHMRDALTSQVMAPSEDATKQLLGEQLASDGA